MKSLWGGVREDVRRAHISPIVLRTVVARLQRLCMSTVQDEQNSGFLPLLSDPVSLRNRTQLAWMHGTQTAIGPTLTSHHREGQTSRKCNIEDATQARRLCTGVTRLRPRD